VLRGDVRLEPEERRPVDERDPPDLLVEGGVEVGVDHGDALVDRRRVGVPGLDRSCLRLALDLGVDGAEHRFLAGEVVVDGALGDARAGRDRVDRRRRVPLAPERRARR
jgi:hypothetical protein